MKRSFVDVRKSILKTLKREGELSLRSLETKVNTSSETIKLHVADLEELGFVEVKQHKAHPLNNRPYTTCKITATGMKYVK